MRWRSTCTRWICERATGQPTELHPDTSAVVLAVLTQLTSPVPLILALTGRARCRPASNTSGEAMLRQAMRAAAVPPFHAMAMAHRAAEAEAAGRSVLHLEVGQPATGAPAAAREAVAAAMARARAAGLHRPRPARPPCAGASPATTPSSTALTVAVDDVLVVAGASAGFTLAFLAAFDVGARVGVLEPGYPCYRNTLLALGMQPVPIPVGPDTRWAPTAELLAAAVAAGRPGRSRGRSSPTGTVLAAERLAAVAAWCSAHGVQLIADEIYHGITYQGPAATVLAATRDAVLINSFSKYFSMTGWRLGWMVVPAHLRDAVERLQQNIYICAPHGVAGGRAGRRSMPPPSSRATCSATPATAPCWCRAWPPPASPRWPRPTVRSTCTPT